ncbi:hypothetical protein ABW20_dc0107415 [Dactylellina cionopaga]|nr:hypothetical protein ABW20_dc0107415 [Dactylellina cionopaga]
MRAAKEADSQVGAMPTGAGSGILNQIPAIITAVGSVFKSCQEQRRLDEQQRMFREAFAEKAMKEDALGGHRKNLVIEEGKLELAKFSQLRWVRYFCPYTLA